MLKEPWWFSEAEVMEVIMKTLEEAPQQTNLTSQAARLSITSNIVKEFRERYDRERDK
tara:strand:+ start:5478 stop:5651 length:174 start_codon:yes stop_codon:yes gene_type:complete